MLELVIDNEIIEGCKQGNGKAQEALYKKCYSPFMKICLRYTSSYDEAGEVLNDAFLKIFVKIKTIPEKAILWVG